MGRSSSRPPSFTEFARSLGVAFTPAQLVLYAVAFDGREPSSFVGEERELGKRLFGPNVSEFSPLSREVFVQVKGARVGGTRFAATRLLHLALTLPLAALAPGEVASALVVGPDLRLARQGLRFALGAATSHPDIARMVREVTRDSFVIRRADGWSVRIECLPATRGGSALRARSLVAVQMTESAFFRDEDFAINDVELFRAVAPRVVPGGMIIIESTPFVQAGIVFDFFSTDFGKPMTAMVAHCPTLLMRPDERMVGIVQRERERDADNASREFDAEFMSTGSGFFFDSVSIDRCVHAGRELRIDAPKGAVIAAGADFGFRSDASALAVAGRVGEVVELYATDELRPSKGAPLVPSRVVEHFAETLKVYGVRSVHTDLHNSETLREMLATHRLQLVDSPETSEKKAERYSAVRSLIREGKVRIPRDARLIAQLKAVVSKPASGGGVTISSPRKGNAHGDLASAFVMAVDALAKARAGVPLPASVREQTGHPRGGYGAIGFDDERERKPVGI